MKYQNINIIGTGIYHPTNIVKNEPFVEHFKKQNIDIVGLLKKTGKKNRYIIENKEENSLTMAIHSSQNALENAKVLPEELDIIVFVSDMPEYLSPSNALIIQNKIEAINAHRVYDINSNCLGMITALDQLNAMMKVNKNLKKALIVGSIVSSDIARSDCPVIYPMGGDASVAIVLESKEEEIKRGVISSKYLTLSKYYNKALSPACGMTKAKTDEVSSYDRRIKWIPFNMEFCPEIWVKMIKEFSKECNFEIEEIEQYFISQLTINYLKNTAKLLGIKKYKEKFPYIADEFGYTGATSPFLAMHRFLENKDIQSGAKSIIASVGTGLTLGSIYYIF
ncbi:MAG: hypothetical protein N4A62_09965 [Marinisporobacter sp.]|jgi:3-oxoacyl-[acyl-carrier-protein] synthase-3|nr:hypothetical protein [Marinisporobacter sp.]